MVGSPAEEQEIPIVSTHRERRVVFMETRGYFRRKIVELLSLTAMMVLLCGMSVSAASKVVNMQKEAGAFSYVGQCESGMTVYHKFKLTKPSFVLVTGVEGSNYGGSFGMNVTLCNKKKKALDESKYVKMEDPADSSTFAEYALAKGTYYVKVSNVGRYGLVVGAATKVKNIAITDKGGKSKSKAATVKTKKKVCGIIATGESTSKADWYKFKVTKSKTLTFKLYAEGTAKVNFTLYGPSYKNGINMADLKNNDASLKTIKKYSWGGNAGNLKVAPGTYYIRVKRSSGSKKSTSAVYYVYWK